MSSSSKGCKPWWKAVMATDELECRLHARQQQLLSPVGDEAAVPSGLCQLPSGLRATEVLDSGGATATGCGFRLLCLALRMRSSVSRAAATSEAASVASAVLCLEERRARGIATFS